ncbi:YcaO-like family protein [Kitasatospora sp. LaBMicrA B282]|uniref:YcaO-like family protein n=1 Tax=Kitasatospora sp. LaBMicrA B282 TaxID=3420949 RepID=UPI003D11D40F
MIAGIRTLAGPGGIPQQLRLAVAELPDLTAELPWQGDRQAFGSSWESDEQAVRGAVGEAAERYCAPWPRPAAETLHGSWHVLRRRGVEALDPTALALGPATTTAAGVRFTPFTRDSEVSWVRGRSLSRACEVYVPAFLVHAGWPQMPGGRREALHCFPVVGGLAAGPTEEFAQHSGLEEVVERDTTAIWWANAPVLPAVPVDAGLAALLTPAERSFEVRLVPLDNLFGVPVLAAAVRDTERGWLTVGAAARPDPREAARKALAEAYLLQLTALSLDNPRTAAALGAGTSRSPLKPWRADRRYLDSYRADFADVREQLCQQQLHLDPRAADRVAAWTWDLPTRAWDGLPALPDPAPAALRARVEDAGHEVLWVDLTTPAATRAGLRAGRIVVPGTVCTTPAAFPVPAGRVVAAGVRLGWRERAARAGELNTFPMPHS